MPRERRLFAIFLIGLKCSLFSQIGRLFLFRLQYSGIDSINHKLLPIEVSVSVNIDERSLTDVLTKVIDAMNGEGGNSAVNDF